METSPTETIEDDRRHFTTVTTIIIIIAIYSQYPDIDINTKIIRTTLALLTMLPTYIAIYDITPLFINQKKRDITNKFYQTHFKK
jgi:hypothetical protein